MIIPKHWAEARLQHRERGRQVTLRRFGWSDDSVEAAQAHADARVREAMDRVLAGETLPRRERRVAYNGADGVPIREEIVDRHGDSVITRNAYGALCLNTPDVLFADMDCPEPPSEFRAGCLIFVTGYVLGAIGISLATALAWPSVLALAIVPAILFWHAGFALYDRTWARRRRTRTGEQWWRDAPSLIRRFVEARPDWRLRVYRTPAGFRLLAMHRTFDPLEADVQACFDALDVDPTFARMCRNQRCFRARISPKPWRIGLSRLRAPYSAAWRPEHADLPERRDWIARYEVAARDHASCHLVETLGSGIEVPEAVAVRDVHDLFCRADSGLPLA